MKKLLFFFVFGSLLLGTKVSGAVGAFVTNNLNFRSGPSTQYTLRGLIPAGTLVFVQICKENWCHIKYNSQTGWVSSRYLSFKDGNDLYRTYAMFPLTNCIMDDLSTHSSGGEHHHGLNERSKTNNLSCYHPKNAKRNALKN